jgi:hypothetical protein
MREPPPLSEPPNQRYGYLIRGLIMLVAGMVSEGLMHPVVPWTYVPGMIIISIGVGIGLGVFDRYLPNIAAIAYFVLAIGFFIVTRSAETSLLPLFLYSGFYDLARFGVRVQFEE